MWLPDSLPERGSRWPDELVVAASRLSENYQYSRRDLLPGRYDHAAVKIRFLHEPVVRAARGQLRVVEDPDFVTVPHQGADRVVNRGEVATT